MEQPQDTTAIDAIRDYLHLHARRHGRQRTAERFGVSRSTLWRFLWTEHVSPRLVAAVTTEFGDSVEKLSWATKRLNESRMPIAASVTRRQLTSADAETVEIVCHTPLATVDELAAFIRIPVNTLRERLARLTKKGLVQSLPHRLPLLGARPQRRFYPTREGINALADGEAGVKRLTRLYPVSRQWFRVLAERLDAVAVLYRVASLIAELDSSEAPVGVEHCRSGPFDMRLRLPSGGSIGLVRQGPTLTSASLRYRVRTIERMNVTERPLVTLILTDSEQDMRRTLRTIADPSEHRETCVAITAEAIIGKAKHSAWQPGGYGYASIPMSDPTFSLADVVRHTHRLGAAYPDLDRSHQKRTSGASRAALPDTTAQFDHALAFSLSRAEKRALDLLASWPFCSPQQLAGLLDGVTERRANQLLRALREHELIQREELGYVLSDQGLTALARRDRAAVGPTLDRWTALRDEQGYIGSMLQTLANQHRHQAGITEFCAMLSAEAAHSPEHEILDLLPTHRSQIIYEHRGTRYMLYPDASFQLGAGDHWHWCLLEFERRATTPKRVPERLRAYRRYFQSDYVRPDHNGQLPLVLFVFESEQAESTFLDTAEQVSPAPFLSSNLDALNQHRVLSRSWRAWGATSPDRHRLQQYGQLLVVQHTRAEHFL